MNQTLDDLNVPSTTGVLMRVFAPVLAALAVLLALTGCTATPAPAPAAPGPRIIREDLMPQYLAEMTKLYAADPTYGYLYKDGLDESGRSDAELTGRKMCALIIAGIAPEEAYAAAYPKVAEAGNVDELEQRDGQLAGRYLCPAP